MITGPDSEGHGEQETDFREVWTPEARAAAAAARKGKGSPKDEGDSTGGRGGKIALADHASAAKELGLKITHQKEAYKHMGGAFTDFAPNKYGIAGMDYAHSVTQRGGHDESVSSRFGVTNLKGQRIGKGSSARAALQDAINNPGLK